MVTEEVKKISIKKNLRIINQFYRSFYGLKEIQPEPETESQSEKESDTMEKRLFYNYDDNTTIINALTEEFVNLKKLESNFEKDIINEIDKNYVSTGSAIFKNQDNTKNFYDKAKKDKIFENNDAKIDKIYNKIFELEGSGRINWINSAVYSNATNPNNNINLSKENGPNEPNFDIAHKFSNNNEMLQNECKEFIKEFLNKEKIIFKDKNTSFGRSDENIKLFIFNNMNINNKDHTNPSPHDVKFIFFDANKYRDHQMGHLNASANDPLNISYTDIENRKEIVRKLIVLKAARNYNYYNHLNKNGISLSFIEFLYFYNYLLKEENNLELVPLIDKRKYGQFELFEKDIKSFLKNNYSNIKIHSDTQTIQNIYFSNKDILKNINKEFIEYEFSKHFKNNMDNVINSLFEFIKTKKEAINNKIDIIQNFIATAGDSGDCLIERRNKIESDCNDRVKEGYMINRSLAELSKGISKIGSKYSFGENSFPLYLERQIDSKCRNQFIDYFTFDKYVTQDNTITNIETDIQEYGIILSIIKHYFCVPLNELFVYTLLVYNTSFFKAPKQNNYKLPTREIEQQKNQSFELKKTFDGRVALPYKDLNSNVGHGNNPSNPPYVNINFLKYFCNINQDKSKLLTIFGYLNDFVRQYTLYEPYFGNREIEEKLFPGKLTNDVELSDIKKSINKRIDYIESFNAATLLGTLETADTLQSLMYKDVGCSIVDAKNNKNYETILNIYNHTTQQNVKQCKDLLEKTNFITNSDRDNWNYKIEELLKLRSSTVEQKAARLGGRKTRKKNRKRNKTVGKKVIRFNRSKLRTKKPKKTKRK